MSDIVIYENGNVELKATVEGDTIWLRQNQIAEIFEKERTVVTRHINNILKDKEVDEKSNVQKIHIANSDKPVKFYSLDIVLAVGYRTNSSIHSLTRSTVATKPKRDNHKTCDEYAL